MNYQDCISWLFALQKSGIKLGLANMRRLNRMIGDPQRKLKFVHVAGTNGKGSCCAMLEAILRAAGYKVGLFTSPHLVEFGERIQINRVPLTAAQLAEQVGYFQQQVEIARQQQWEPTFFEVVTAMAFRVFAQERVDIVVLETGLGGRLDSTNVVKPECSVITGIGFDHMNYLGHTLAAIAGEKAAIIKRWRPVVIGRMAEEAHRVMERSAEGVNSPIYLPQEAELLSRQVQPPVQIFSCDGREYRLQLLGNYQLNNAALVLRACDALTDGGWDISETARREGLRQAEWPGRFQVISTQPLMIVEGSHNEQGISATLASWHELIGHGPQRVIFGCLQDKDIPAMTQILDRPGWEIWLVPIEAVRGTDPVLLSSYFHQATTRVMSSAAAAIDAAKQEDKSCLVVGSLYLAGQILAALRQRQHEVVLNG